jgi:hypothetical protein
MKSHESHNTDIKSKMSVGIAKIDGKNTINTITTSLIFASLSSSRNLQFNKYLYTFKQSNSSYSDEIKPAGVYALPINIFDNNTIFELEFINGKYVRIKHNNGIADYYLNYTNNNVCFYNYESDPQTITYERNDMFTYEIDDIGYLTLYKILVVVIFVS